MVEKRNFLIHACKYYIGVHMTRDGTLDICSATNGAHVETRSE